MSRRKKRRNRTQTPAPAPAPHPGDLRLMENIATWCRASKESIVAMCDWHVQREDGGVLAFKGKEGAKILVVAHMDYLRSGTVHELDAHHIVSSALDDRLGCCLAYNLEYYTGIKADVVFTDMEESGRTTLPLFGKKMLDKYNWIVEFDRRGEGAVRYQFSCMDDYIKKHFTLHQGSFSDICKIYDYSPVGAFNMAVGYDGEHAETCNATTIRVCNQLIRFKRFYAEFGDTKIAHTPVVYKPVHSNATGYQYWRKWDDDDDGYTGTNYGTGWKGPGGVWDPQKRLWTYDNKGNILPAAKVIQLPGTYDPDEEPKPAANPRTPQEALGLSKDTVIIDSELSDADIETLFDKGFVWDIDLQEWVLDMEIMDDDVDLKLTKEDLKEYEDMGFIYDPETGEFYNKEGFLS